MRGEVTSLLARAARLAESSEEEAMEEEDMKEEESDAEADSDREETTAAEGRVLSVESWGRAADTAFFV